jgi:hypothetical protein
MLRTQMAGKFKSMFAGVFKSLHQLWLEVIGALFLVFAAAFGFHAVSEFRASAGSPENPLWLLGAAALSLLTLGFGIHSFWKARKLR